ncbi:MAG: hypothetical protein ACOYOT_08585 [Bacteroidales bacterium]
MGWFDKNKNESKPFLTKVRDSFRGQRKKELLTFFVFLFISAFFWFLQWMKESLENQILVPVEIVNVPRNVLLTSELPKCLTVNIKDKGATILSYYFSRPIPAFRIDYNELSLRRGSATITPDLIVSQLQKKFVPSIEISSIFPESLTILFSRGESKVMPITLLTAISTTSACGISGSIRVIPSTVTIYAPKQKLKEVETVFSELLQSHNVKDTLHTTVHLQRIEGVKIVPNSVQVIVPVEPFTEKNMEVAIDGVGAPVGYKMRLFPVKTNVVCRVAISKYDKVDARDFRLIVDYDSSKGGVDAKYPVRLVHSTKYVSKVRFQPSEVEVLMEDGQ